MKLPMQISFHNMPHSAEIEKRIRNEVVQLERFYPYIMGCRVLVDLPQRHRREGNPYEFKISLTVPGTEIVVNREPTIYSGKNHLNETKITKSEEVDVVHKDVLSAINEAFDTTRRVLQDYAREIRRDVKTHQQVPRARVSKIFRRKGYGVLRTPQGRAIYFDKDSVVDSKFHDLTIGTRVTFLEESGEKGPQALFVAPTDTFKPAITMP